MKKSIVLGGVFSLFLALPGFSHEGPHGPEQKLAPHGGILRDGATLMTEMAKQGGKIRIYFVSHEGKAIDPAQVEVDKEKSSLMDSKKKAIPFQFVSAQGGLDLKFEPTGSHRYSLEVQTKYLGKVNKGKWQVEMGGE